MMNVMKRAWEIYRTLTGDHIAKLAMALKDAWAEAKNTAKKTATEGIMKVKAWVIEKAQNEAKRYNMWFNIPAEGRDADGMHTITADGYDYIIAEEILAETEKAIKVRIATGWVDGSSKGFCTWIPKSQIA